MDTLNTMEKLNGHVMPTYGRLPLAVEKGQGRVCQGENGKTYLDFGSGIGTNSLGFCDDAWADAVCAQVRSVQHTSNYYYTKVQADFAERLCAAAGYAKLFFGNSGAEANECAIKLARKYSYDKYGRDAKRWKILTLKNSFHGRTITTLSATGQDSFHTSFFPFTEGFDYVEAGNLEDFRARLDGQVCAVMVEFIQGEGGVIPLNREFVAEVFRISAEKDVLTIADEVQTGVGRTGKFLASEHYGVHPNVTTLAKGLAGGLPIGVCLADASCCNVLSKGSHGSTFGGNPVACAGAGAVLDRVLSPGFLEDVEEKGKYLKEQLLSIPEISSVDGMGLMLGASLKTQKAAEVLERCLEEGLLILTAKDKLRFLPPLTCTKEEIQEGVDILRRVLA